MTSFIILENEFRSLIRNSLENIIRGRLDNKYSKLFSIYFSECLLSPKKILKPYLTPSTSPTSPMPVCISLYLFYMVNNTVNNICLIDIHS